MKSIRLYGPGDLRLQEEPVPVPGVGEKLLRVTAVGICGSDIHWFSEAGIGDARLEKPLVLGHEFAARIEDEIRVAVDPTIACGVCQFCIEGNPNFCEKLVFAGHGQQDGAMREQIAWPERCLFPLPDSLSDADGVMLEPLGIAIHAVDLAHLRAGMNVGVFGCGPIGLLIVQLVRLSGARVLVATDKLSHRVEAAKSFSVENAFLATDRIEVQKVTKACNLHVTFEVAGENDAVEDAVAATRPGGKVMLVGIPADDRTAFTASVARRKGLTLKLVRRMKNTYPRAIELVSKGLVDVRSLVTHKFPLTQAAEAFVVAARRDGLKVIVEC